MKTYNFCIALACLVLCCCVTSTRADTMILRPTSVIDLQHTAVGPVSAAAFKFDLSQLPEGARIDLAELQIRLDTDTSSTNAMSISFGLASADWVHTAVTLDDQVATSDSLFVTALIEPGSDRAVEVDLTELVKLWHSATVENHGIVVSSPGNELRQVRLGGIVPSESATLTIFYTVVTSSK